MLFSWEGEDMLSNEFLENKYSYRVNAEDMSMFLSECEAEGLKWNHGKKPLDFNPIEFYAGDKIQFLAPLQKIEDRNKVYIKCFYGNLYFSFYYNWSVQPAVDYKA